MRRKFGIVMVLPPGDLIGDLIGELVYDIGCIEPSWQRTARA